MNNTIFKFADDIEWSLPLLFQHEPVLGVLNNVFKEYEIALPKINVFGSCGNVWTGGRTPSIFGEFSARMLYKIFEYVKNSNAVPTLTFTAMNIDENILKNKYANLLLDIGLEVGARFIVYSDLLKDYIKNKNSNAEIISSVIKSQIRFQGPTRLEEPTIENETNYYNELLKEYDVVVVRPEYSRDILSNHPEYLSDPTRVEVLINQVCINNCPYMPEHYRSIEQFNSNPNPLNGKRFQCVRKTMSASSLIQNNVAHSDKCIQKLVNAGYKRLKIQGRGISSIMTSVLFLVASQMLKSDGNNYLILNDIADGRLDREFQKFREFIGDILISDILQNTNLRQGIN